MLSRLRPHREPKTQPMAATDDRLPAAGASNTSHTTNNDAVPITEKQRDLEAQGEGWVDPYGPPPGIKGWFKLYWHDLVAFIFLAAIALWLLLWSPVPYKKYFAISYDPTQSNSITVEPEYGYPKRKQYVPIIGQAMAGVFTPIVTIVLVNFFGIGTYYPLGVRVPKNRLRGSFFLGRGSFWNVNNGCMGVIYSVMTGATIQIIIKLVIPGMRPHFLTVCDPQIGPDTKGVGYRGMYFTTSICRDHEDSKRQDEIANALQSFPSGHSVAAWAGLFYLSLYLNAHLKIFSNYHPSYWKLLAFVTPMIAATLMVGALHLDMSHNWYDIVAGSLIGIAMALLAYRMCFASIWDFRWNHVPLRRGANRTSEDTPGFAYSPDEMRMWCGGCGTRRAGWGVPHGSLFGAPGDSSGLFASGFMPGGHGMDYGHGVGHGRGYPAENNGHAHMGSAHPGHGNGGPGIHGNSAVV